MNRLKIALLTTDSREHFQDYANPQPCFGTAPEALLQGLAGLSDTETHVLSCVQRPVVSPERLASNIFYHSLLVPRLGWMRTGYLGCIRAVRAALRDLGPDLVHGQGTERDCAITAVFSGFPNVLTIHGNMRLVARVNRARPFSYEWLAARLERFTLPRARGVICITRYTQEAVRGFARQTWLLPNAVDGRFFEVVRAPSAPPEVLVVGFICPRKNQNAFVRALDPIARRQPIRLTFLGRAVRGDPYAEEFFGLLAARPWCGWEGFVSRDELRRRLATAALLALPSVEDNCPMTVLEAAAAGVPVAAARVGGVPDLVEDGVTGLLFDPADPDAMAGAVRQIIEDPQKAGRLAKAAHAEARARYHPQRVAREHVRIYRQVLGHRG